MPLNNVWSFLLYFKLFLAHLSVQFLSFLNYYFVEIGIWCRNIYTVNGVITFLTEFLQNFRIQPKLQNKHLSMHSLLIIHTDQTYICINRLWILKFFSGIIFILQYFMCSLCNRHHAFCFRNKFDFIIVIASARLTVLCQNVKNSAVLCASYQH